MAWDKENEMDGIAIASIAGSSVDRLSLPQQI